MGRLRALQARLTTFAPRIGFGSIEGQSYTAHRAQVAPWRNWYKTARWRALRMQVLLRDHFTCQREGCGRIEGNTALLVANHKTPHRGDPALFWAEGNLECVCKPCHDGPIQAEERRALSA